MVGGVGNEFAHRKDWALGALDILERKRLHINSPSTTRLILSKRTPTRIPNTLAASRRQPSPPEYRLLANIRSTLPNPTMKQHVGA
jgi:hypothetical protein